MKGHHWQGIALGHADTQQPQGFQAGVEGLVQAEDGDQVGHLGQEDLDLVHGTGGVVQDQVEALFSGLVGAAQVFGLAQVGLEPEHQGIVVLPGGFG